MSISDKPLETSEATVNQIKNVETPAKEPDELESDSEQNKTESQQ